MSGLSTPRVRDRHQFWTTLRECRFLKGLGTFRPKGCRPRDWPIRTELLIAYRDSMHKRVNWEFVDPAEIRAYIAGELKRS